MLYYNKKVVWLIKQTDLYMKNTSRNQLSKKELRGISGGPYTVAAFWDGFQKKGDNGPVLESSNFFTGRRPGFSQIFGFKKP